MFASQVDLSIPHPIQKGASLFYNHIGTRQYVFEFIDSILGNEASWDNRHYTKDLEDRLIKLSTQENLKKEDYPCMSLLSVREEQYGNVHPTNAVLCLLDFDRIYDHQIIIDLCKDFGGPPIDAGGGNPSERLQLREAFTRFWMHHCPRQVGFSVSGNPKVAFLLEWDRGKHLSFMKVGKYMTFKKLIDKNQGWKVDSIKNFKNTIRKVLWDYFLKDFFSSKGLPLELIDCLDTSDAALTKNFFNYDTLDKWVDVIKNLKPINITKHWDAYYKDARLALEKETFKENQLNFIQEVKKQKFFKDLREDFKEKLDLMHPEYKNQVNRLFPVYLGELPYKLKGLLKNRDHKDFYEALLRSLLGIMHSRNKYDLPSSVLALNVHYHTENELGFSCAKKQCKYEKRVSRFLKDLRNLNLIECISQTVVRGKKGFTYRLMGEFKNFCVKIGRKISKTSSKVLRKQIPAFIRDGNWHEQLMNASAHFIDDPLGFIKWFKRMKGSGEKDRADQAFSIIKWRLERWMDYPNNSRVDLHRECYDRLNFSQFLS